MKSNLIFCFLLASVAGCTSTSDNASARADTITHTLPVPAPLPEVDGNKPMQVAEEECIFYNNRKELTAEALFVYDSTLAFRWLETTKEAIVVLEADTLKLSLGGCAHFNYSATYISSKAPIEDTSFWFSKARWMAQAFMNKTMVHKFKMNPIGKSFDKNLVHYDFPPDTVETNFFVNGITLEKMGASVKMSVGAYYN